MKKLLSLVFVLAIILSICSGAFADGSKELTIYFAFTDDEIPTYVEAFKQDTGIQINYVRMSAGDIIARLIAEKDNPQASVICGGNCMLATGAAQQGLLEKYESPVLAEVPEEFHDPDGFWTPVTVAAHVFLVNNEWFEEENATVPDSWEALLDPSLKGMVMMAHPSSSGVASSMLVNMYQYKGEEGCWEYFEQLKDILPYFNKASSAGPAAVCLGEAAVALTLDSDALKYKNQGYDVSIVYPETTFVDVNCAAIVKNGPADEAENAKTFIDWMISERGQNQYIESGACRCPVNVNATAAEGMKAISDVKAFACDKVAAAAIQSDLIKEFMDKIDNAAALK